MDVNFLKLLLSSCESATKDLDTNYELMTNSKYQYFPLSEKVVNALSASFTNLLCYKVSEKMHQRHAIQMKVIESLRLCTKIEDIFGIIESQFHNVDCTSIAVKLLLKNLTHKGIKELSQSTLQFLYDLILFLQYKDNDLKTYLDHILISLVKHPLIDEGSEFIENALIQNIMYLDKRTVEMIFKYNSKHLIEKPLIDDFCNYINTPVEAEFKFHSCDKLLLENIVLYSSVFRITCVILKNIFVRTNYAEVVLKFTKLLLNGIMQKCDDDIQFLELYPAKLQPCVCLMKIEPRLHSLKSKDQVCELIQNISINNKDEVIILLMHFPSWLDLLL